MSYTDPPHSIKHALGGIDELDVCFEELDAVNPYKVLDWRKPGELHAHTEVGGAPLNRKKMQTALDIALAEERAEDEARRAAIPALCASVGHYSRQLKLPPKEKSLSTSTKKRKAATEAATDGKTQRKRTATEIAHCASASSSSVAPIRVATKPGPRDMIMKNWQSNALKRADRLAKRQGLSHEQIVAARREVFRRATEEWKLANDVMDGSDVE